MSKMFLIPTKEGLRTMTTWNVFTGCRFACSYCWAKHMVETRLKNTAKYQACGFEPTFHPLEIGRKFKPGDWVFVAALGDISFAREEELRAIFQVIKAHPDTKFLVQSKDPHSFFWWTWWPDNVCFGTTIESNRDYDKSKAPPPLGRFQNISKIQHPHKFLSIEPILCFDLEVIFSWVKDIAPEIVEIGYDNYNNSLPEPTLRETLELSHRLSSFTKVVLKTMREPKAGR